MEKDKNRYKLSDEEHKLIFDKKIKEETLAGAAPVKQPTAVILGGQPRLWKIYFN